MLIKKLFIIFLWLMTTTYAKNVLTNYLTKSYIEKKVKELANKSNKNNQCVKDILHVVNGIKNDELWALRMFDSSSKLNPGLTNGNLVQFGSFDACLAIDHSLNSSTKIKGKYCTYIIKINGMFNAVIENFQIKYNLKQLLNIMENLQSRYIKFKNQSLPILGALCIPNSCKIKDIQMLLDILELDKYLPKITLLLNDSYCQTIDDFTYNKWKTSAWLGVTFFVFIGILMFTNTIYHVYLIIYNKRPKHRIFLIFSVYANLKKLVSTKDDPNHILCLNGLRTISMMWIILGHRFLLSAMFTNVNATYILEDWMYGPMAGIISAATLAVDTFFIISGILVIYTTLMYKSKGTKFSFFYYYIHRYIRLTPAIGAVIIVYVTFFQHLVHGPLWHLIINFNKPCYTNWWITILYIQNFWPAKDTCISQCWYVSIDTQLYALAPIIFIPLQKWPTKTLFGMIILILISCFTAFYSSWINHVSGHPFAGVANFTNLYASTPVRMSSWLIGCIIGYILFKTRGKKININKFLVFFIWVTVLLTMNYFVFETMFFTNYEISQIYSSSHYVLPRILWCICLGWIIWACFHGYGGIVDKFLSCRIFTILGRLTYSMYLLQIGILTIYFGKTQTPAYFSNFTEMHAFWGDFFSITVAAMFWYLTFELPLLQLTNYSNLRVK